MAQKNEAHLRLLFGEFAEETEQVIYFIGTILVRYN